MTAPRGKSSRGLFSASQVSTYEMCPRKWAWQKVDGLDSPPNKYAEMGQQVHHHLENWLTKRQLPQVGEAAVVANAMIPHLPPPQAINPDDVEREFHWRFHEVAFRGFIDLIHFDSSQQIPVTIYDHKTTSDLRWAKSGDDLVVDPQATLYARVLMEQTSTDAVQLQWTYATRTARPQVLPVKRLVTCDEILPRVSQTVASAREMKLILDSGVTAIEVPYDASACDAFGGCPFQNNCNLNVKQRIQSAMSQETAKSSFLQRLQARKAANGGASPTPPPPASEPALSAPAPSPSPAPAPSPAPMAVNPPEAHKAAAPPQMRFKPAAPPVVEEVAAPVEEEPEPVKRGRGRPRKVTPELPKNLEAALDDIVAGKALTEAAAQLAAPVPVGAFGWTLYLDCQPVKGGNAEHISDRLQRVMLAFTAETGLSHYKLADYGKGPALFAEGFARDLAENRPHSGIIASTASQEVRDILQVLMASASTIVQG